MATAATREQADFAVGHAIGPDDVGRVEVNREQVGVGRRHSLQGFANDVIGVVNKLFHSNEIGLAWIAKLRKN
jgi:hypothetical protein